MNWKKYLGWFVNPWVIGGALIVALFLYVFAMSLFWLTRPKALPSPPATAVLNIIRVPSATFTSPVPTPIQGQTPSPANPVDLQIQVGSTVQVVNTGGGGLRLRDRPGLSSNVLLLAAEGETLQVQDGPQAIDGYTWWYVVSASDPTRLGWAVADFLSVYQAP